MSTSSIEVKEGNNSLTSSLFQDLTDLIHQIIVYCVKIDTVSLTMELVALGIIVSLIIAVCLNIYFKILKRNKQILLEDEKEQEIEEQLKQKQEEDAKLKNEKNYDLLHKSKFLEQPIISDDLNLTKERKQDCIEWMNEAISWFYQSLSNDNFVNDISNNWLSTLNQKSRKLTDENGIFVEFITVEQSSSPSLSQVKLAEEINENIITTMKTTNDHLAIQVRVASDFNARQNQFAIYNVIFERFSALLKVVCITDESLIVIRPIEKPETKAILQGPLLGSKNKFQPDLIITSILNIITSTIFDLNFAKYRDFPKISLANVAKEKKASKLTSSAHNINSNSNHVERKLLVKIVKAYDLNLNPTDSHHLYCTVEMDQPFQSNKTSTIRDGIVSPVWDQHFMLNLNERSNEIFFELLDSQKQTRTDSDHQNDEILGNAIVNVDELSSNPSQTKNLCLQSTFDQSKNFGFLTVEFLLMEHNTAHQLPVSIENQQKNTMDLRMNNQRFNSDIYEQNQQSTSRSDYDQLANSGTYFDEQTDFKNEKDDFQRINSTDDQLFNEATGNPLSDSPPATKPKDSRSLLRNLKKRFSFNKKRSKSVERYIGNIDRTATLHSFNLNQSQERDDDLEGRMIRARSVPGSREPSMPKENLQNDRVKESLGNLSQQSARTFLHDDSILIMECQEADGSTKHYVMPKNCDVEKSSVNKLRRRASSKLHLFRDHLFIAKHIPSSRLCQVCSKKFPLKFGKQAYQCRECGLLCHKPCHVDVGQKCRSNAIASLNFEILNQDVRDIENNNINYENEQLIDSSDIKKNELFNNCQIPELKITDPNGFNESTEDCIKHESKMEFDWKQK